MKAKDAISGLEGELLANYTIGGSLGLTETGTSIVVAECKNITAKITKEKAEFKALGYRGKQYKAKGWSGSGTLTIYYATSRWAKMMAYYAKTGQDTYFTLQFTNYDPTSAIGQQKVKLKDVNFDEVEIAKLDVDADFLDATMNFTFSGVEIVEEFKEHSKDNEIWADGDGAWVEKSSTSDDTTTDTTDTTGTT